MKILPDYFNYDFTCTENKHGLCRHFVVSYWEKHVKIQKVFETFKALRWVCSVFPNKAMISGKITWSKICALFRREVLCALYKLHCKKQDAVAEDLIWLTANDISRKNNKTSIHPRLQRIQDMSEDIKQQMVTHIKANDYCVLLLD